MLLQIIASNPDMLIPDKAMIAMSKLCGELSFIVTTATAIAEPIDIPTPLAAARKPEALLKYFLGISLMIAVLLAGKNNDIPAPASSIVPNTKGMPVSGVYKIASNRPIIIASSPKNEEMFGPCFIVKYPLMGDTITLMIWNGNISIP